MKTFKAHGESDLVDSSVKADEREDSKDTSGGLRNALITQCEQDYENLINAVRKFSIHKQSTLISTECIFICIIPAGINPRG